VCARGARSLEDAAARADEAQGVVGIDALDELRLHGVLRDGLAGPGVGVLAEQRYPGARSRRRRSEGERCDIVLTREPDPARNRLVDPLDAGTLFEGRGVEPEDALWIEVKVAWRHAIIDGSARADPRYAPTLRRASAADLRKLAADARIRHAALLMVVFAPDEEIARTDAATWRGLASVEGWPVGGVHEAGFPIADRIGNGWTHLVLAGVARR
jgi:hypothetical protein